jgi:hypothetical protein
MNDYDDNAKAPVLWDLLRFLTAAKLNNPKEDLSKIIKSYQAGLLNEKIDWPSSILNLKDESVKSGRKPQAKLFDEKNELLKRTDTTEELTGPLQGQLAKALENAYGKDFGKILDGLIAERASGGSGGLNRYHVLINVKQNSGTDSKFVILEFKQLIKAAPADFTGETQPTESERIKDSLEATQDQNYSRFYSVQVVGGQKMLLRPRFAGNKGVSLSSFTAAEQSEIVYAEAMVLGTLHSKTLTKNSDAYVASLQKVKNDELIKVGESMADYFINMFALLKGP